MNKKQERLLWVGIAIIVLMGIFPPVMLSETDGGGYCGEGNGFIFNISDVRVDAPQLFVQWVMVAVVTGGLFVTFKDRKKIEKEK